MAETVTTRFHTEEMSDVGEAPTRRDHCTSTSNTCHGTFVRHIAKQRSKFSLTIASRACKMVLSLSSSTILYNVLELPVGAIPVTRVDPAQDQLTPDWYKPESSEASPLIQRFLYKGDGAIYNADKMAGLPVGIQVVGKRWEDEKVIEMMKVIDSAIGPRDFGPGSWQRVMDKLDKSALKTSSSTGA